MFPSHDPGGKLFADILLYQNRIDSLKIDDKQKFTLTIEPQTLNENFNVDQDSPVDVLFGQSLQENAPTRFASIHKVEGPTSRPGSYFKFVIRVRKDLFD